MSGNPRIETNRTAGAAPVRANIQARPAGQPADILQHQHPGFEYQRDGQAFSADGRMAAASRAGDPQGTHVKAAARMVEEDLREIKDLTQKGATSHLEELDALRRRLDKDLGNLSRYMNASPGAAAAALGNGNPNAPGARLADIMEGLKANAIDVLGNRGSDFLAASVRVMRASKPAPYCLSPEDAKAASGMVKAYLDGVSWTSSATGDGGHDPAVAAQAGQQLMKDLAAKLPKDQYSQIAAPSLVLAGWYKFANNITSDAEARNHGTQNLLRCATDIMKEVLPDMINQVIPGSRSAAKVAGVVAKYMIGVDSAPKQVDPQEIKDDMMLRFKGAKAAALSVPGLTAAEKTNITRYFDNQMQWFDAIYNSAKH